MKKCIFALLFFGFAVAGWSQTDIERILDTTFFSCENPYLWEFYQDLQAYVSINHESFLQEEDILYKNFLDTLEIKTRYIYLPGTIEIEKSKEDLNRITIVFMGDTGEIFLLHFIRGYKDLLLIKEKIFIKMVITNETNEAGQSLVDVSKLPVIWSRIDPEPIDIIERVIKKFF